MKKTRRLYVFIFILVGLIFIGLRAYLYLNACVKLRGKVAYYTEMLMFSPEIANTIIPYEMLSDEYKERVSLEDYTTANEPDELLELYSNPVFQQNTERNVDISLSTEGYKKEPEGYFQVGDKWYYMKHEIDVAPDWITLESKIVRWNIMIVETEKPEHLSN